jgi:hypothetical protein
VSSDVTLSAVREPTENEIANALRGPAVPASMSFADFPHVVLCDARTSSPRVATVLAVALSPAGAVVWAKRVFMSHMDEAVIALRSAEAKN